MSFNIETPPELRGTELQQLGQVRSYLFRLAESLGVAFDNISGTQAATPASSGQVLSAKDYIELREMIKASEKGVLQEIKAEVEKQLEIAEESGDFDGPQGEPGPPGPKGDPGTGVYISGTVASPDMLPTTAEQSEMWNVGAAAPYNIYMFDNGVWRDLGQLQGPQGEPGEKGEKGDPGDGGGASVTVSPDMPAEPSIGDMWYDSDDDGGAAMLVDLIYPVGSIYSSSKPTDPGVLFGGTWKRIEDVVILAASDKYPAGSTGGEAEHTLTKSEMPSHQHLVCGYSTSGSDYTSSGALLGFTYNSVTVGWGGKTSNTGDSQPHNNMPPYYAAYMWERVS